LFQRGQDIGEHPAIDQSKLKGRVELRQLPGMQWAEASRSDQLKAVFHIAKSLILPRVHGLLHVLKDNETDRTALASKGGAQGVGVP
jgi:xanthine dehydrogenase molybdopterin-binding subunit B